jgi:two-component system OmpR family response regulator
VARPLVMLVGLEAEFGAALEVHLDRRGYDIRRANDAWQRDRGTAGRNADVAVVNQAAPGAIDLLRSLATDDGPACVMIVARSDVVERVLALELGASDVVEADIAPRELAARIGGLLARRGGGPELVVFENVTVDLRAALVMHRTGGEETLSPGQVALLRLFLANPRKVLSREDIIAAAPAEVSDAFDRSIDSRIVRLRRKLDTESIVTIRGAGYRFEPPTGSRSGKSPD